MVKKVLCTVRDVAQAFITNNSHYTADLLELLPQDVLDTELDYEFGFDNILDVLLLIQEVGHKRGQHFLKIMGAGKGLSLMERTDLLGCFVIYPVPEYLPMDQACLVREIKFLYYLWWEIITGREVYGGKL